MVTILSKHKELCQRFLKVARRFLRHTYIQNDEGEEFKKGDKVLVNLTRPNPPYLPTDFPKDRESYWLHVRLVIPGSKQIIVFDYQGTAVVAHPNQVHHAPRDQSHLYEDVIPQDWADDLNIMNPAEPL